MYFANSRATTKKKFKSIADKKGEKMESHKIIQLNLQKTEKEWKAKIRKINKSNK